MRMPGGKAAKRIVLEGAGWTLVVVGVILMPLPGPGLLIVLGGVALLARQYDWAERNLTRVRLRALREAARSVSGPLSMAVTILGMLTLIAVGVYWIVSPPVPSWYPLPEAYWLPGGITTGIFQIASAIFALGLMVYSYRRFHDNPAALAELEDDIDENDDPTAPRVDPGPSPSARTTAAPK